LTSRERMATKATMKTMGTERMMGMIWLPSTELSTPLMTMMVVFVMMTLRMEMTVGQREPMTVKTMMTVTLMMIVIMMVMMRPMRSS